MYLVILVKSRYFKIHVSWLLGASSVSHWIGALTNQAAGVALLNSYSSQSRDQVSGVLSKLVNVNEDVRCFRRTVPHHAARSRDDEA